MKFSSDTLAHIDELKKQYPEGRQKSALLPVLHLAQKELGGYLSTPVMDYVAEILAIQPIEVYEVATFYSMFHLKPTGKYVLSVCHTAPCCLSGAEEIIHYIEKKLGIKSGETTADGLFTLERVECLASCGTAPVMQLGNSYRENLTPTKIDQLLGELR